MLLRRDARRRDGEPAARAHQSCNDRLRARLAREIGEVMLADEGAVESRARCRRGDACNALPEVRDRRDEQEVRRCEWRRSLDHPRARLARRLRRAERSSVGDS